jgi:hypothetical protein
VCLLAVQLQCLLRAHIYAQHIERVWFSCSLDMDGRLEQHLC